MSAPSGVDVVTFGCRLNAVESDAMRAAALAAGHRALTIVNTCAVTAEASRQARQAIRRIRRERPGTRLVVTGCAAETEADVFRAMPEIDAILRNGEKTSPGSWPRVDESVPEGTLLAEAVGRHTRGFVEIQNGCDHRCTFCIIPFGRGASRSVPTEIVIRQIERLVEAGAREVVLTGVDITAYGADLVDAPSLGLLVRRILKAIPQLPRLRLSSLDCFEADPALLEVLGEEPRLMPHLHLSLQTGSDLILKRMKRRHLRADALAFCHAVRRLRPDVAFGADFIVGFPTETEAMFADTLDVVEACGLTYIHAFPFSARPGTPAARMPQLPSQAVKVRSARLRALADTRLADHLDRHVGQRLEVLTERAGKARAADFTAVRLAGTPAPGRLVQARIEGHDGRELTGVIA